MSTIAVIIVNYGTADLAIEAVDSVLSRPAGARPAEIHLVDNASPGDDARRLAAKAAEGAWAGKVEVYPETTNHGFGRGNNIVLERLAARDRPPDYVFLLNPDARLENDAVTVLAEFLDQHPKAAIAGARARNPDSNAPVAAAFRFPSLPGIFGQAVNFGPVTRIFSSRLVALPPDIGTRKVDWVSGAAVMARFGVWRDLGFFDPTYFLYCEEVDLMLRSSRAGWDCWHVDEARIIHAEGASTEVRSTAPKSRRPAYWYDSWRHYFAKNHGRGYAISTAFAWAAGAALGKVFALAMRRNDLAPPGFFGDLVHHVILPLVRNKG